jgi:prepilin-type N-terminal cleavage/methylation domain-containing protein
MMSARASRSEAGFTLIEVMMVVMLIGIVMSMALFQIGYARPGIVADGGMRTVMAQLNLARDTAVAQRRLVDLEFDEVNHIKRVVRRDLPQGTTVLATTPFEGGVRFGLPAGLNTDTPEKFGLDGPPIAFGAAQTIRFNTEGMLVDGSGNPLNGTVFLMIPENVGSARAVTVLGSVGRVRGYRWNGTIWTRA